MFQCSKWKNCQKKEGKKVLRPKMEKKLKKEEKKVKFQGQKVKNVLKKRVFGQKMVHRFQKLLNT